MLLEGGDLWQGLVGKGTLRKQAQQGESAQEKDDQQGRQRGPSRKTEDLQEQEDHGKVSEGQACEGPS